MTKQNTSNERKNTMDLTNIKTEADHIKPLANTISQIALETFMEASAGGDFSDDVLAMIAKDKVRAHAKEGSDDQVFPVWGVFDKESDFDEPVETILYAVADILANPAKKAAILRSQVKSLEQAIAALELRSR